MEDFELNQHDFDVVFWEIIAEESDRSPYASKWHKDTLEVWSSQLKNNRSHSDQ